MNRTVIADLGRALRVLGEHGERISPTEVTPGLLHEIADDLERARRLLALADRPRPTNPCRRHPYGPLDPDRGGACLLCGVHRPRGRTVPAAGPDVVLAVYDQFGGYEASRRYGPAAVALALAKRGRGSHTHPPHLRPQPDDREELAG